LKDYVHFYGNIEVYAAHGLKIPDGISNEVVNNGKLFKWLTFYKLSGSID
jgi:hypothetical protein